MTQTNLLDKLPPQDIEAERCVLGSVLLLNEAIDEVVTHLTWQSFYADANRRVFRAIHEMYEAGSRGIDAVTLRDELTRRGQLEEIGGTDYLMQLLETVPHAAHAEYYAKIVRQKYEQRALIEACTTSIKEAYQGDADSEDMLATAEQRITAISASHTEGFVPMAEIIQAVELLIAERHDTDGASGVGLPTGSRELDKQIGGLKRKNLIVIAARPAMGKTAFSCDVAKKLVSHPNNRPGVVVSLEMSKEELTERLLCSEARISLEKLQSGNLADFEHHDYSAAAARMRGWPLLIDDSPYQKISLLCAKLRRLKRTHKIEWAIIDYLQLIEPDDERINRELQVAKNCRKLKQVAKELDIPLIVLSQLNRGVEQREDKRPRLSDLRESGAIEQDADSVMFLHRPDAYDPEDRPGQIDIIVAKNRHGKPGTVTMSWLGRYMTYEDFSPVADVGNEF